jgi:hypothetical protein
MRMRALSSAPAAVRMRLHRKRRREGTHYVRIPLESLEIEGLTESPTQGAPGEGGVIRPVAKELRAAAVTAESTQSPAQNASNTVTN